MHKGLGRSSFCANEALINSLISPLHAVNPQRILSDRLVFVAVTNGHAVLVPLDSGLRPTTEPAAEGRRFALIDHDVAAGYFGPQRFHHFQPDVVLRLAHTVGRCAPIRAAVFRLDVLQRQDAETDRKILQRRRSVRVDPEPSAMTQVHR